jgi:putative membrane protein insertion efficiency factor
MLPSPDSKPTITPSSGEARRVWRRRVNGPTVAVHVVVALISAYKVLLSPLFGGSCRFEPSCSAYMVEAVRSHGALKGIGLGLRRLARCHPFGGYGFDPVSGRTTGDRS